MQALHSSSALGVNIFQYWQDIDQVSVIAAACGFCQSGNNISKKIVFEEKQKNYLCWNSTQYRRGHS
jgi:hypothetical protein